MSGRVGDRPPPRSQHAARVSTSASSIRDNGAWILALLLALRIANALSIRTFFQPDEYFQSLEPAWHIAFGADSGAWITWEWKAGLRSSLHPYLFAAAYRAASAVTNALTLSDEVRAEVLLACPKVVQAIIAALGDYFTYRLGSIAYGAGSRSTSACLLLTVVSPWQWFCSTRTFSNALETTLTVAALCHWPWEWATFTSVIDQGLEAVSRRSKPKPSNGAGGPNTTTANLPLSMLLAATACILRPTNTLIWLVIGLGTLLHVRERAFAGSLILAALTCGTAILGLTAVADRAYYGAWTLPPVRFLHYNIAQGVAGFYGRMRADYYLTEALPLLLTTALPFALLGLWTGLRGRSSCGLLVLFAWTCLISTTALSLVAHKEVRFLYPLLPLLHVIAAAPFSSFFARPRSRSRNASLALLLAINLVIAVYTTRIHQRGVIDVTHHLRSLAFQRQTPHSASGPLTAAFLMPCHSTPWRSHLVSPNIDAWALTCEPPLHIPANDTAARAAYRDEADVFYDAPALWLEEHMQPLTRGGRGGKAGDGARPRQGDGARLGARKREWPTHLVLFAQLEPALRQFFDAAAAADEGGDRQYVEAWRGFNSHWHDDWRRRGDVVVWERRQTKGAR